MNSTVHPIEWKGEESTGNDWNQRGFPFVAAVRSAVLAPLDFIARSTEVGALRFAAQQAGKDDFEVADEIAISHGYMSKVLKGTAGLHGQRLVAFMRATGSLAPLQWLADQMGCDITQRDPAKARIQELERELQQLRKSA
jgi:hypothetical protein